MRDPYVVLGVDPFFAKEKDISRAFRKLAKKLHPDKPGGSEVAFKELSQAYEILGDVQRREAWDEFGEASLRVGFDLATARRRAAQPAWASPGPVSRSSVDPPVWATPKSQPREYVQHFSPDPPPRPERTDHGSFGSFGAFGPKGPGDL